MLARYDGSGQITAALGPTNTGKTHLAVERMLARSSGMIGLPLRLLAREVYDRVVKVKGAGAAALITGEEKIVPPNARYFICTAEAMPLDRRVAFMAIDEVQLAADHERGHVFTDRLLRARGTEETMILGAGTMSRLIRELVPQADTEFRERFSQLSYAGPAKVTRLPRRSAVVAFSAESVYAIAELLRRRRGGARPDTAGARSYGHHSAAAGPPGVASQRGVQRGARCALSKWRRWPSGRNSATWRPTAPACWS